MNIEEKLNELEEFIENNFNKTQFEKEVFDLINHLSTVEDILRLASIIRWAPYENEDNAIETALNITDRAIEKSVESNNKEELETRAKDWWRLLAEASCVEHNSKPVLSDSDLHYIANLLNRNTRMKWLMPLIIETAIDEGEADEF